MRHIWAKKSDLGHNIAPVSVSVRTHWRCSSLPRVVHTYLILDQHGDVHKHVMELLDAALQPHDVFVSGFDLVQGLLVDLGVHDLSRACG